MISHSRKILAINIVLAVALLAGSVMYPSVQTQAASISPNMSVTLSSGGSTYASTVYAGQKLTFKAKVKNIGNVPLRVTANLTVPENWVVDEDKYSECDAGDLGVRKSCTTVWKFTPQASGQVYLRVYVRGYYTAADGSSARITNSPAFIFNVKPARSK